MRVPIYPNDLQPRGSFKRLAEVLKKKWPGHLPIQQVLVNEILSKGLGYLSCYQVRSTSLTCHPKTPPPPEAEVRARIAAEISSVLNQSNDTSVPRTAMDRFVDTLPLNALSVYKKAGSPIKHFKLDLTSDHTGPVNDECPATQIPNYTCPAPVQVPVPVPTISFNRTRLLRKPAKSVHQSYINAIKKVVESSDSRLPAKTATSVDLILLDSPS